MATLKILCAGAAQAVTEKIVVQLSDQGEHTFEVHYDAVNAFEGKVARRRACGRGSAEAHR